MASRSPKAVKEMFEAEKEAEKVGFKVNTDKTKFMVVSRSQNLRNRFGQGMEIGKYSFEIVDEFTYLGTIIT